MITDFDIHPKTGKLVLAISSVTGEMWLRITDRSGSTVSEISPRFLPQHARWSESGDRVAFAGNDGRLFIHDLASDRSKLVFDDTRYQAGFPEWSGDDSVLLFSAYRRPRVDWDERTTPNIYTLSLPNLSRRKLTQGAAYVDRFPRWAPAGDRICFHRQDLDTPGTSKRATVLSLGDGKVTELWPEDGDQEFGRFPWSADGEWFVLRHRVNDGSRLVVVNREGQEADWSLKGQDVNAGVFLPNPDLLCLTGEQLIRVEWPGGRERSRISLEKGAAIKRNLTWHKVAFDNDGAVYFLDDRSRLHRWDRDGQSDVITEEIEEAPTYAIEAIPVRSFDGLTIPAVRLIPKTPARCAILYVQGGPGTFADRDSWADQLADRGFEVVRVPYRGTSGLNDALSSAGKGEMGLADVSDVVEVGKQWVRRHGNGRSVALFGNSYGAYLSLLALARDDSPFAGAVCTCSFPSLRSMPLYWDRALPAGLDRETEIAKRSVPAVASRIKKPVLLYHGGLDTVATTDEIENLASSLARGELVVYDDDTHSLQRHRQEIYTQAVRFYNRLSSELAA